MKFYYDLLSQPSRTLYILLKINKVPAEFNPLSLRKREHLTAKFKEINRFQKVPCIVDNDLKLSESIAILRYLDGKGVIDERWYPKELHLRARTDEYLAWHHNNTRLTLSLYFWQKWLHPLITGRNPDPKQLAETQKNMETTLDSFENIWLENRKYLTGSEINAADVFAACEILQPMMAGYDPTRGRPNLGNWLQTVRSDLNPQFDEAHDIVMKISKASGIIQAQMKVVNFFRNLFRRKK